MWNICFSDFQILKTWQKCHKRQVFHVVMQMRDALGGCASVSVAGQIPGSSEGPGRRGLLGTASWAGSLSIPSGVFVEELVMLDDFVVAERIRGGAGFFLTEPVPLAVGGTVAVQIDDGQHVAQLVEEAAARRFGQAGSLAQKRAQIVQARYIGEIGRAHV